MEVEEAETRRQQSSSSSTTTLVILTAAFLIASVFFFNNSIIHGFSPPSSFLTWSSNQAAHNLPNGSRHSSSLLEKACAVRRDPKLEKVEASLAMARALIKEAAATLNCTASSALHQDSGYVPYGDVYRNPCAFHR